jgi:hypothetical protein
MHDGALQLQLHLQVHDQPSLLTLHAYSPQAYAAGVALFVFSEEAEETSATCVGAACTVVRI